MQQAKIPPAGPKAAPQLASFIVIWPLGNGLFSDVKIIVLGLLQPGCHIYIPYIYLILILIL